MVTATVHGYAGRLVTLEERWNRGPWRTVGVRRIGVSGRVRIAVRLSDRGVLRLRLTYPSGQSVVGSTVVR